MKYIEIELSFNDDDDEPRRLLSEAKLTESDVFIYNGDIIPPLHKLLRKHIGASGRKRAFLLLTTPGGDADAAYRVARHFQDTYEHFTIGVWGSCKSAGTLLAIGASELVIADCGELGPLDVQVFSPDEFVRSSSGLSIAQAIEFVANKAFETWEDTFLMVRQRSGGIITTKTASEIASALSVGLFSPITEKIDPNWLGELQRSIDIALHYGVRLGMERKDVRALIEDYPCHSFVIDYREAELLFRCVRRPNDGEELLFRNIIASPDADFDGDILRDHSAEDLLVKINIEAEVSDSITENEHENEGQEDPDHPDTTADQADTDARAPHQDAKAQNHDHGQ